MMAGGQCISEDIAAVVMVGVGVGMVVGGRTPGARACRSGEAIDL